MPAVRIAVVVIAVVVLADSYVRARRLHVTPGEQRVFRRFNDLPDTIHPPVWAVMQTGSLAAVWVTAAVLWAIDHDAEAVTAALVGTAVWGGVKIGKHYVGRGRPRAHLTGVHVRGQVQTGLGYPSGHAAVSMSLALIATHGAAPAVVVAGVAVALFTGCARMYVGAHLPLDVAAGIAMGVIVGQVAALAL